jgi:hypothetical protein
LITGEAAGYELQAEQHDHDEAYRKNDGTGYTQLRLRRSRKGERRDASENSSGQ